MSSFLDYTLNIYTTAVYNSTGNILSTGQHWTCDPQTQRRNQGTLDL